MTRPVPPQAAEPRAATPRPSTPRSGSRRRHRFVYGPVPSRRLGFSLGVDIVPYKACSLDCVYCQLRSVGRTTCQRRAWFDAREVLDQVSRALGSGRRIDAVTFSGSGEPTLNTNLGRIIRGVKEMTDVPVVVLTNGTLLTRKSVMRDLLAADIVVPSLDAVTARVFQAVNRPHPSLVAEEIVRGLVAFRREFRGLIWLEVMLVKGMNDRPAHVRELKAAIEAIRPDRVQLNTVVRPPADPRAKPLARGELERIRRVLGPRAEIIAPFGDKRQRPATDDLAAAMEAMIRRRPVTSADIRASLGRSASAVGATLRALILAKRIRKIRHGRRVFYEPA